MTKDQLEYLKELAAKCRWFKDFADDEAKLLAIVAAHEPAAPHPDTVRLDWLERFGADHGWTDEANGQTLLIDETFKAPLRVDIDERICAENRRASAT